MTVQNCIKRLEAYKKQAENPVNESGMPLIGSERKHVIEQSKANYEMMKKHILTSRKFQGHPILEELKDKPQEKKEEPIEETKSKKRR